MSKSDNLDFSKKPLANPEMKDIILGLSTLHGNKFQVEIDPNFISPVISTSTVEPTSAQSEMELEAEKLVEKRLKRKKRLYKKKRCFVCEKKTGLLGFECRCDIEKIFCSTHRHEHNCTFDFKSHDINILRKNNQMVRANKLERI